MKFKARITRSEFGGLAYSLTLNAVGKGCVSEGTDSYSYSTQGVLNHLLIATVIRSGCAFGLLKRNSGVVQCESLRIVQLSQFVWPKWHLDSAKEINPKHIPRA